MCPYGESRVSHKELDESKKQIFYIIYSRCKSRFHPDDATVPPSLNYITKVLQGECDVPSKVPKKSAKSAAKPPSDTVASFVIAIYESLLSRKSL
jgi:hypothetical protein